MYKDPYPAGWGEFDNSKIDTEEEIIESEIKEYMGYEDPPEDNLPKNKSRGDRRQSDLTHALKRRAKDRRRSSFMRHDWYDNLHEYSKGKIHCSCPMCRIRTNSRKCIVSEPPIRDRRKLIKLYSEEDFSAVAKQ